MTFWERQRLRVCWLLASVFSLRSFSGLLLLSESMDWNVLILSPETRVEDPLRL